MYQPVTLFVGLRYTRGRASDYFNRLVSWLSTIGITIGVMSLIIILSAMNGFEYELEANILNLIPQVLITSKEGNINPQKIPSQELKLHGVTRFMMLTTADVVLQSSNNISVGVMLGINPDESDPLTPFLINTQQKLLQPGEYNIIIGKQLATSLGVKKGDQLRLIVPSVRQLTPIGYIISQRIFTIVGIYSTNSEVEDYQILINQQDASHIMRYPTGNITGWRLLLDKPLRVNIYSSQKLPHDLIWKDWRERKGDLFKAVNMEKNLIGLLLSLIIIVATFNIITSLGLLIMEKCAEIAILQIQGLSRRQIITIFMINGARAGIIGTLFGTLIGLLFASNLNTFTPIIHLLLNDIIIPIKINIWQILTIDLSSIAISLLSTLYPSWHASNIQPAKVLRHE